MRYLVNGYKALYNRDAVLLRGIKRVCSRDVAPHRRLRQGSGSAATGHRAFSQDDRHVVVIVPCDSRA